MILLLFHHKVYKHTLTAPQPPGEDPNIYMGISRRLGPAQGKLYNINVNVGSNNAKNCSSGMNILGPNIYLGE